VLLACLRDRFRIAGGQLRIPLPPWPTAGELLERHEQRVIVQPLVLLVAVDEVLERLSQLGIGCRAELAPRLAEQLHLVRTDALELHVIGRELRHVGYGAGTQQTFLQQLLR
jgi:hypothetical protein